MNSLLVGVGISDRAAPGNDPVADAVTAEAMGYDFVSAFDHPVADAVTAEAVGYDVVSDHPSGPTRRMKPRPCSRGSPPARRISASCPGCSGCRSGGPP